MLKKFLLLLIFIMAAAPVFAIEREDLNLEFFNAFHDPYLLQYLNEAVDNNHDARVATQRVEEYRQNIKLAFAQELPSIRVSAGYLGASIPYVNIDKNAFVLPFTANYEADIFGRSRDRTKSAKMIYEMSKLDEQSVYLALLTDVASIYTNILQYDELIAGQENLAANYAQILADGQKKFSRGLITNTDLNNAQTSLKHANTELQNLTKQREVLLMQLAVMTGRDAADKEELRRGTLAAFEYDAEIPAAIESDVIFARPDLQRAEKALEKAKIDVRVARKNFLPTFNILGVLTFNTIGPGSFFSWGSSLGALLAGLTQDLFTGGKKSAELKLQKAKYEEMLESYTQTGLEAAKEVNMALCFIKHDVLIEDNAKENLALSTKNFADAQKMLDNGLFSRSQYLMSANQCVSSRMDLIRAKTQRIINYYTLYKSAGGRLSS